MPNITGINEKSMIHSDKNNIAVIRGAVNRFVTRDIKLKVLKLYAINGSVNTVADIVIIKDVKTIFKSFITTLNLFMLFNFDMSLLFNPVVSIIPKVAENDN